MATAVKTLQNFVAGDWVEATGDEAREIVSPVTGEKLADAPNASEEDVKRAAKAARDAQPKWAALSAWDRAKVCHAIADLIEERKEDFARELSLEQGKPYTAEAIPDIEETAENFRIAAEDVKRMETAVIPSQDVNKRILTFRKPNGVYAGITPWNFPTLIPVELIAPGIAAGNAIVMKPSEWTPIAMANFMQIMADAGLPDGVVNVVYGDGKVGERLIQDENVDCVGFVGSHDDRGEDRPRRRAQALADRGERERAGGRLRRRRPRGRREGRRLRRLLLRRPGLLRDGARPRRQAGPRGLPRRGREGGRRLEARRSLRRRDPRRAR